MKRLALVLAPLAFASTAGLASEIDCFPMCAPEATPPRAFNACEVKVVQEGAKLDAKLKPVKDVYEIATDPTGYAMRTVTEAAGIHVPKVVGYALNPKGSLKAEVMKRLREEAKKQVGLQDGCAAEIAAAAATTEE